MDLWHTFFFIGFHGWIRRHSCLSDYSRNFAEFWPLANGSRPIYAPVVFGHADFADDADFSSWDYFVPQISQIYTDFFESLVNRFVRSQGVSATTGQVASAKFRVIRWIKKSASSAKSAWLKKRPKKNLCKSVKSVGLFPISGGICNDRIGRLREIPCHPMNKKICVICEICVTWKTSQEKSV